jgi:hypothetical protein
MGFNEQDMEIHIVRIAITLATGMVQVELRLNFAFHSSWARGTFSRNCWR